MTTLTFAVIALALLVAGVLVIRSLWSRCCPSCSSRLLRQVTSIRSDGRGPESRGNFTFYRCEACGESLQSQDGQKITTATHWRNFVGDNDVSNPTRPNT